MSDLTLPIARLPFVNKDGTLTKQAVRALMTIFQRAGGAAGDTGDDQYTSAMATFLSLTSDQGPDPQQPSPANDVGEVYQPRVSGELPIGALFFTTDTTDPATSLGYGSWDAYGAGQVPVGLKTADPNFGVLGATGGSKTAAISAHAGTAVDDHPPHVHGFTQGGNSGAASLLAIDTSGSGASAQGTTDASAAFPHTVTQPNDHTPVSVLQPYVVVNIWKRVS